MRILVGITALAACVSAISTSALFHNVPFIDHGNHHHHGSNFNNIIERMQRDLSFLLSLTGDLQNRLGIAEGKLTKLDDVEVSVAALQS